MPDLMDGAQDYNEAHNADALQRHAARPRQVGRTHCANLECGEPIGDARRALGAQLCILCQQAEEASAVHLARWRQR